MNFLKGAVLRGGFHSYFDMASAEEVELAIRGFRQNGAPLVAQLIERAASVLFPSGIPSDVRDQLQQLPTWTDEEMTGGVEPEWSRRLDEVDASFYATEELVHQVVEAYFETQFGSNRS